MEHWPQTTRLYLTLFLLNHAWQRILVIVLGLNKSNNNWWHHYKVGRTLDITYHGLSLARCTRKYDRGLSHLYCLLSCTGWTSRSGSCISLLWWSTDVSRTMRRCICRTTACQSLKLPVSNCDLPLVISFYWFHDIVSEHSAVGLLLWLARRSGTHWQMNCELTLVIGLN